MGNRNAIQNDDNNNRDNEQILIQNDGRNPLAKIDPPSVKKIFAVRNPFSIKKTSLILEKDAGPTNSFYIKFEYDSLYNFNCYINLEVTKNPSKELNPKQIPDADNYILAYNPSPAFESKKIVIKNVAKGESMEFFEKDAIIDIDFYKSNKAENKNEQTFDLSIELVPIIENNDNNNEIVFVSLCSFEQEEIGKHPHSLKIEQQKLKTYGMWIDIHDIYNSALDSGECLICCSAFRNTIFLPCNHACTCDTCAHRLKMRNNPCPICKNPIKDLLILEVDENVKAINYNDNFLKEEIINVNYSDNNNNSNEVTNENINNENNINIENNNILNNNNQNENQNQNNQNNIEDEEKEKINQENQ